MNNTFLHMLVYRYTYIYIHIYISVVLQIPCEKMFKYPKPTPKSLAEGIGAYGYIEL